MKKLFFLFSIFLLFANCSDNNLIDDTDDCTKVSCTEQFVTLFVTVKNNSGTSISLDDFEVLDKETSENTTIKLNDNSWQMARQSGKYPLYNDLLVAENQNTLRTIVFRGFINNEKIVERQFVIDTDCCHVSIASGNENIIVN